MLAAVVLSQADEVTDERRIKVFISSTYLDNKDRRKVVEDAVIRAGMVPVGMERFTASQQPTVEDCERLAPSKVKCCSTGNSTGAGCVRAC